MFPFQQNDDFPTQISFNPQQEDLFNQGDLVFSPTSLEGSNTNPTANLGEGVSQPQSSTYLPTSNIANDANLTSEETKANRKEIERQRRQQMSTLHASLRSLLPLEYIKGKRSMSDQMNEAVNYINHLKNNIQDLSFQRDRLKKVPDSSNLEHESQSSDQILQHHVTVRPYFGGVEIAISSVGGSEGQSFLLSRVLEAVMEEGFDVVSCVSTKREEGLYNTIQCQATNETSIDLAGLEEKLNDVISSSS